MRILGAAAVLLAACGGGGPVQPDALGGDGGSGVDSAPSCGTTWSLVDVPATALTLLDAEAGFEGRAVRIGVTVTLGGCDDLATMTLGYTLEGAGIQVRPRAWRPVGPACGAPDREVTRPLVLDQLYAATWQIDAFGADSLHVTVRGGAPACVVGRADCLLDCDCDEAAGERCLSYGSFAGPATQCAVPCELDRDCGGTACEPDVADGLGHVCSTRPECDVGHACPTGWTCDAGACAPDFTLDQGSRHACACDADCEPGLRCAEAVPPATRRCEALCETPGPWCQGAHVCGWAEADASGLAGVDSVCIWLGE